MQKVIMVLVVMLALVAGSAVKGQASPDKRFDQGTQTCRILGFDSMWWGDGAKIFQNNCKSCHYRGNDKGAPFLYAESKSPEAWNRVFFKKYPQCAKDGSWGALSLGDQLKLNDYLYRNGANTYNPNTASDCG
ncbi:MAG: c-type cytochrome [Thermodesulfobacteriota bacterium]